MRLFKKLFLHSPFRYIAAAVLCAAIITIMLVTRGADLRLHFYDAFTTAGVITMLFGLLLLVWYFGTFDIFGFSFSAMLHTTERRYKTLYDYTEAKKEKRQSGKLLFMPYITVGALVLAIGLIIGIGL